MRYGYLTDNGKIVSKLILDDDAKIPPSEFNFIEVADKKALDLITVDLSENCLIEQKIQSKMRQIAIDALIAEGQLPPEFK